MSKILIVENESQQRWLYADELRSDGHQVIAVGQGEQALSVLEHMPIELIVMDLKFTDDQCPDYLQKIVMQHRNVKVIINSASLNCMQDFQTWAADRFIIKSSDLSELKHTIDEMMTV